MAEYGIPYMGSKNKIMHQMIHLFPKADHFYDLFGGGFSVTHAMVQRRSQHYKQFQFNEIRPGICDLIKRAIRGDYAYDQFKMPWIPMQEFKDKKEIDAFIKIIWSFGNNGQNYLYSEEIEPYKKSLHQCVIFDEFDEISETVIGKNKWPPNISILRRRLFIRHRIEYFRKTKIPDILKQFLNIKQLEQLQQLQQLQQLEQLQRLQQLEQLQRLQQLHFSTGDYRTVSIEKNSVIYCDIPYDVELAESYNDPGKPKFNRCEFLDWASNQTEPIFISEYEINDPRFKILKEINCRTNFSGASSRKQIVERIFIPNRDDSIYNYRNEIVQYV